VLSSRDPKSASDAALKAGAISYYQKPVDLDVLLKNINEALGLVAPAAPPPATTPSSPPPQS
jgi:DNA-binding NarL/FixJ family response regulator